MSDSLKDKTLNYIEFPVTSPEALVRTQVFFTKVFGWEYQAWGDSYADTQSSGIGSGINAQDDSPPVPLPVVYVADLDATLHQIEEAGAEILKPIYSFPGGRRFHFREPSGHELAVWSDQPGPDSTTN
jgi:uncharacterized protein